MAANEEVERKRTIWNKILHVPIQGGRELIWTAMGAYAIPTMEFFGITADIGSTVFSASSFATIFTSLIVGVLSDRCSSPIGKRRPFIIICVIFVIIAAILQFLSLKMTDVATGGILLYSAFFIYDLFLWTLQVPMYSYLMESFNEKEQAQVMQSVAFICGFAGIVGYVLCGYLPISENGVVQLDIFFISVGVFIIGAVMNLFSIPESPNEETPKTSVLSIFKNIPTQLLKMCLLFLFNFSKDFPFYIFFTTCYAESMYGAHRPTIENSGNKTEEEIDIIFKERLTDGTLEASKVFIAFPAGTMLFSLIFEKAKIFRRFGIKRTVISSLLFMIFVLALNIFTHTKLGFFLIAVAMAFSLCIQVSVPYMLLGIYRENPSYPKSRGLSSDNSIISSTFSVGQAAAILLSFIVQKTGRTTVIIPWSLGSAILALITAFYLDYGSNEASKSNENEKQEDIQLTDNRNENL